MSQRRSDGWEKRVGTGVGLPPSLWERYGMYGLILTLTTVLVLSGLMILAAVEHWSG